MTTSATKTAQYETGCGRGGRCGGGGRWSAPWAPHHGPRAGRPAPAPPDHPPRHEFLNRPSGLPGPAGKEAPTQIVAADNDPAGGPADHVHIADQLVRRLLDAEPDVELTPLPVTGCEQLREALRPGLHAPHSALPSLAWRPQTRIASRSPIPSRIRAKTPATSRIPSRRSELRPASSGPAPG